MTIQFNCPNCDALIAFDSKHMGQRAHCVNCGQKFIIPHKDYEKPRKIKPEPERTEPLAGFYRAVLADSWKIFSNSKNATSLVFVVAVVCFKFFLAHMFCCAYPTIIIAWGWLFGFYLNIIYETAFGEETLPEIYLGTSITFLWYIIRPFLVFLFTLFIVQLPFFIALSLLQDKGVTYENMWVSHSGYHLLLQILLVVGLFFFPMAILTTAVGQDYFMLFRPDYILAPVLRAFIPYLIVVALLVAACFLEMQTTQYHASASAAILSIAGSLALNLAVQVLAIIAMRSIGLFYRHYSCYLRW